MLRIVDTFQYSYLKKWVFSKSIENYTEYSNQSVNQLLLFTYRALVIRFLKYKIKTMNIILHGNKAIIMLQLVQ